jgi:hypothetical protein
VISWPIQLALCGTAEAARLRGTNTRLVDCQSPVCPTPQPGVASHYRKPTSAAHQKIQMKGPEFDGDSDCTVLPSIRRRQIFSRKEINSASLTSCYICAFRRTPMSTYVPNWRSFDYESQKCLARLQESEVTPVLLRAAGQAGRQQGSRGVNQGARPERAENLRAIVADVRSASHTSVRDLAAELNRRSILTPRGGEWHATSVVRLLERLGWQSNHAVP